MGSQTKLEIAKFGGTSVADYDAMLKSAQIVKNSPESRVVVLSASAGVTNLLIALAEGREKKIRLQHLATIEEIQVKIMSKLAQPEQVKNKIIQLLNNVHHLAEAASLATSTALTDELVAHGELLSSTLFTQILNELSINAVLFDVRQVMRTDNHFGSAMPILDDVKKLSCAHIKPLLENAIVVTQGFIGSEASGKTTTLGRGGSDYTAALLGEVLQAEQINIWTDVAGIYTTDPRIVDKATLINEISFSEAAEMATFGAKVLHPATIMPAVRQNIPVFVGSSKHPNYGGTIVKQSTETQPVFRAIALRRKQTLLILHSLKMLHAQGFLANVFSVLAKHNISVDLVTTSEVSIAITIDTAGTKTDGKSYLSEDLMQELSALCHVEVKEDLALIAIIGNNLTKTKNIPKEVFGIIDEASIYLISLGASTHNLCFLVKQSDADDTIRQLHHHLFE